MKANRWILSTLLGLAVAAAGCGGGSTSTAGSAGGANTGPIIVGAAVSETGFLSAFDQPVMATFRSAMNDLNAKGGIKGRQLQLQTIDVKSDSSLAASAAQRLIEQGAQILLVTCDLRTGGPAITVAEQAGIVSFAPCGSDVRFGPLGTFNHDFTPGLPIPTEGAVMAQFAYTTKQWRNVFTLTDNSLDYTKLQCAAFQERYKQLGGNIAGQDVFVNSDQSVATQVSRIASLTPKPDAVVLCSYPPGGATAVLQVRQAGVDLPILAGFGMDGNYWTKSVPNLSNFFNVTSASVYGDDPTPAVQQLLTRYTNETGSPPATGSFIDGAATVQIIQKGYEIAGTTDGSALTKALETLKDFPTVAGPITYDSKYHASLNKPTEVVGAAGGKFSYITTIKPSDVASLVHF